MNHSLEVTVSLINEVDKSHFLICIYLKIPVLLQVIVAKYLILPLSEQSPGIIAIFYLYLCLYICQLNLDS